MRDPADLYELRPDVPEISGAVLLVNLDGYIDAGAAGRQAVQSLLAGADPTEVAVFDIDRLLDYRSRRPVMTFDGNRWTDYAAPGLTLSLAHDAEDTPYLLLTGLEPDREWELFAAAVRQLVERFSVSLTVAFHGIPMAVPHTRPATVTAHATSPDLVSGHTPWTGNLQVPGSAVNLLEYRLGQAGHDFIGFAVHVPSYLAQSEYPRAAMTALEFVSGATGLSLPTAPLEEAAQATDAEIEQQVAASEEVQRVVRNLEQQYDEFMASHGEADGGDPLLASDESALPTAEELGAELERFLAERERGTEG
ncbi:proteasome assembly chaperone family protein [Marinitenerispora sediminis]|uniref:Proteasome protein n=1 Tax=Marinitenerispora sediminis TaxID=1931232 RepID=A0A368T131_9ACTN|nr:PAC2 family protein [Marinitenerispora sediminis]RCV50227.1 proteasome protein [Marinitenerispora sediminis]RCV53498.1 proteasome protein [Marinitenerispora sediminis]RCV54565.1 proteasome protein [Marinitenerispora sediminis]